MSRQTSRTWPAERVASAAAMWKQGWSGGQIGRELGVTRNAVIGQLSRMGLTNESRNPGAPRPLRSNEAPPSVPWRSRKPPKPPPQLAAVGTVTPLNIMMRDIINGQCRWPTWQTESGWPDFLLCGLPAATGSPYCGDHARIGTAGKLTRDRGITVTHHPKKHGSTP